MIVYFNGSYIPRGEVRISPDDRGFLFGDGVYEVIRSYGGSFLEPDAHLRRLRNGLRSLGYPKVDEDFTRVAKELLQANDLSGAGAVAYFQITRGAPAQRTHAYPDPPVTPTVYGTVFPIKLKADPAVGIEVNTIPDIRWGRCDIKTVNLLANCMSQQRARESGVFESVMVRDGVALEASASSFFAVIDGEVRTAPLTNYILPSITRSLVLRLCREAGIPCRETPVYDHELPAAGEMFLAGTTLEILPIVGMDGRKIGSGAPGTITTQLMDRFREHVAAISATA